eukprot:2048601-Amphidinium_carterae.1
MGLTAAEVEAHAYCRVPNSVCTTRKTYCQDMSDDAKTRVVLEGHLKAKSNFWAKGNKLCHVCWKMPRRCGRGPMSRQWLN